MFQPGLQTHFPNDRIDGRFLDEVRPRVYWCRVDAQKADPAITRAIGDDITSRGCRPLVTCWSSADLSGLPPSDVEYQNERSIKLGNTPALPGAVYRQNWETDFWPAVNAGGHCGYFGAAANFEKRDLDWYRDTQAGTLPPEVVCTIHDYWTGTNLDSRLALWRGIIGQERDYLISECGVNGLDPAGIAAYMTKKWAFWSQQSHCLGLVYFQIFDDVLNHVPMGLYDGNFQLKQVVFDTFPVVTQEAQETTDMTNFAISRARCVPHPQQAGYFTYQYPKGADTVLSVQPDGTFQSRPAGTAGAWEKFYLDEDRRRAVFDETAESFAFPLVD